MTLFALRISLDAYTDWYNSPHAAILFWSGFTIVVLLAAAILFRMFRHTQRPH